MAEIEIPFSREMAIAALDGFKTATTRSDKKGEIGDTFRIINPRIPNNPASGIFRIIDIIEIDLDAVRDSCFRLEGFDSPEAFEKTWRALHRGHYSTKRLYFMHHFGRVV